MVFISIVMLSSAEENLVTCTLVYDTYEKRTPLFRFNYTGKYNFVVFDLKFVSCYLLVF